MKLLRIVAVLVCALAIARTARAQEVSRAVFTSGPHVVTREPLDSLDQIGAQRTGVYFFSEVRGMSGRAIVHRWEYGGEVQIEVSFAVLSDNWKTYSFKMLKPTQGGTWTVSVLDEAGSVLRREAILYTASEPQEPAVAEPHARAPESSPEAAELSDPVEETGAMREPEEAESGGAAPGAEGAHGGAPAVRPRLGARDDPDSVWQERQR